MYKIIVDSCADMTAEMREKYNPVLIPFRMLLEDKEFVDDLSLDVDGFIDEFTRSKSAPKSSCPSPADYLHALEGADEYYIICLSKKLSGTHNSAMVAKNMFESEKRPGKVVVIDSKSAACGETLLVAKIHEMKLQGKAFDTVVKEITKFVESMKTFFVLESFSNLIKNGRMPKWKGILAATLQIIPIMHAEDGDIKVFEKLRNIERVYNRFVEVIRQGLIASKRKLVCISYVTDNSRAIQIKKDLEHHCENVEVLISKTAGLSSMSAD
ncbi:MAG: DegV family protein, partial [Bacillota bacterium]|nr:DegV family protein [Bacillota bacterium]